MFTGIILAMGEIASLEATAGDCRLTINTGKLPMESVNLGDSIAVNGICLTVVEFGNEYFCADVSRETLDRTTLRTAVQGAPVNLELALTPSTRLGGHFVSGHVDGVGQVLKKQSDGRSYRFEVQAPDELKKYIAEKGAICIDGISLTVNIVQGAVFGVNIVPHTLQETTLGQIGPGTKVNLEVDLLARYLERLLTGDDAQSINSGVSQELLQNTGFLKG